MINGSTFVKLLMGKKIYSFCHTIVSGYNLILFMMNPIFSSPVQIRQQEMRRVKHCYAISFLLDWIMRLIKETGVAAPVTGCSLHEMRLVLNLLQPLLICTINIYAIRTWNSFLVWNISCNCKSEHYVMCCILASWDSRHLTVYLSGRVFLAISKE